MGNHHLPALASAPKITAKRHKILLTAQTNPMPIEDKDDFIDQVAQAVIDRIEERNRVSGLVEMVVQRVFQLQNEEAALQAAAEAATDTPLPQPCLDSKKEEKTSGSE
jgi:hypothetical protein